MAKTTSRYLLFSDLQPVISPSLPGNGFLANPPSPTCPHLGALASQKLLVFIAGTCAPVICSFYLHWLTFLVVTSAFCLCVVRVGFYTSGC